MARNRKKKRRAAEAATGLAVKGAKTIQEKGPRIMDFLKSPAAKGIASTLALEQLLGSYNKRADRGVQSEALQMQGEASTPESLYVQAALPQARQEESMARQMLMQQLSGGVTGPSVGRGERLIGRR